MRPAEFPDLPAITALLESTGLPTAGLHGPATRLYLVDGEVPGEAGATIGLEIRGAHALLRSLAVRPELRGRGYGRALVAHGLREARALGARRVYGLTTTIPELLARWGFEEVRRNALPAPLAASAELKGACPSNARAFYRRAG